MKKKLRILFLALLVIWSLSVPALATESTGPVYIAGKLGLFRTLHVYVGEPIMMDDLRAEGINTQTCQTLLGRITESYAALDAARPEA